MEVILARAVSVKLRGGNGSGLKKTVEKWTQQMLTDFVSFAVEGNRNELVAGELCMVNKSCFCVLFLR